MVRQAAICGWLALALGLSSAHTLRGPAQVKSLHPRQNNGSTSGAYLDVISDYVDSISETLWPVNQEIHENPELAYEEVKAHDLLTSFLEEQEGWTVTKSVGNIATAFMAVFEGSGDGPVVSFNAEYDALPGLGHACGHNLIAMASLGGALATAEVIRKESLPGKVILFGTPAEESGGGKIKMLEAGIFDDAGIDISLISHPGMIGDSAFMKTMSTDRFEVEYYGREAHAAASPWEGINAQDALLLANNALSFLRQQMRPTDRVHGIISSSGTRANIIPALASGSYQVRASDETQLAMLTDRVVACFEAGALASGAKLNLTMQPYGYANMVSNEVLASFYGTAFEALGGDVPDLELDKSRDPAASTDQGNISHDFPSISPTFGIFNENGSSPTTGPHTAAFQVAAGTRKSFDKSLMVAKGLASVAIDVLTVNGLLDQIKEEFEKTKSPKLRKYR